MSYQLFKEDVLFYQRFLKAAGLYSGGMDGSWGPQTNKADADFTAKTASIAEQYGTFDSTSESHIASLLPKTQIEARKFLQIAKDKQVDVRILSGTRTYDEQNALYAHGRNGNTQPVVTNAKGGQSNHNFGIAWDIGIFDSNGSYLSSDTQYKSFAAVALPLMDGAVEWGGNWITFKDFPHYQLKPVTESVTAIRSLFEEGNMYA
ncbi:MAG TPA: M15 family metallopeptidase [Chitinophagaceae bacterium]